MPCTAPRPLHYLSIDRGTSQSFYARSRRRLLVFDYDGTLVTHHALAELAAPPPVILEVLESLCEVSQCSANRVTSHCFKKE